MAALPGGSGSAGPVCEEYRFLPASPTPGVSPRSPEAAPEPAPPTPSARCSSLTLLAASTAACQNPPPVGHSCQVKGRHVKVETGIYTSRLEDVASFARNVEALGYDGLVTAETAHDSFLPLVLAAEHTERVTLGTSVAIAFPRSPMVTAMIAWDLQRFSKGRFILGLGTQVKGHNQRRFSVTWSPPAPRIKEYVESLRAIWNTFQTGEKLEYVGQHYSFTLMTPNFNPGPVDHPHIPVHIA
ncbi:MAG: LLM class flavin-dependent oxidoreductase, partial [Dehalococcoidia bacterium]|nr:LLM class flavin-dependent oxidoreductase [Dehalococcoidia bacterium]